MDTVGNRLSSSNRYRGSRESLQSGMTYSARRNSNSSAYNGTRFTFLLNMFGYFYFLLIAFPIIAFNLKYFHLMLDNDYYYGGSMRDLNNGHGRPRKSSSVSHLGEFTYKSRCLHITVSNRICMLSKFIFPTHRLHLASHISSEFHQITGNVLTR